MTGTITTTLSGAARTLARRVLGVAIATAALFLGFAVAGNASQAHADTTAGAEAFGSIVECGGDSLVFWSNSTAAYGSFAQVWVYDSYAGEWVTDGNWVDANEDASYNVADLTFEPGYYLVYVEYAQWNGYDFDFSGEYIDTYEQYYSYDDVATESFCYMGNDLSTY